MKSAILQIVSALDKSERFDLSVIRFNGECVSFHLLASNENKPPETQDEVTQWLRDNGGATD